LPRNTNKKEISLENKGNQTEMKDSAKAPAWNFPSTKSMNSTRNLKKERKSNVMQPLLKAVKLPLQSLKPKNKSKNNK
tara:strand:+ start:799 stop:1032 length:234 start_codon:yes stop_codon:yes gene_type:complete